jgi:hypothetical protein
MAIIKNIIVWILEVVAASIYYAYAACYYTYIACRMVVYKLCYRNPSQRMKDKQL